ncbi:MAG: hypothetical protein FWD57_00495 [Polyangiaceae bacterium]|nr:hypothetical protein [Polyangiaceae bacterium]
MFQSWRFLSAIRVSRRYGSRILGLLGSVLLGVILAISVSGCLGCTMAGQKALGLMPGVVNDPGNRSLRRSILGFGLDEFCKQLVNTGAPLRMRDDEPVVGRFFARSCSSSELDSGDVFVQLDGIAYTWTNASQRVALEVSAAIQYNQDFLMHGSTMYAYFRTRNIAYQNTRLTLVEQSAVLGVGIAPIADDVAPQMMRNQLERGFTVIRDSDASVEFSLGVVELGERPNKPYEVRNDGKLTLMNERSEIRGNQLDFLGPFAVPSNGQALFITMTVEGTTVVDAMVVDKMVGDQWLDLFVRNRGVPQPPLPPLVSEVVPSGEKWQKTVRVSKGFYYVVIDNSAVVGAAMPPRGGTIPPAALVSVVVQVGSAP